MQSFTWKVNLFFPDTPKDLIQGIISFDDETGPILEIIGKDFVTLHTDDAEGRGMQWGTLVNKPIEILLGYSEHGQPITLYQCHKTNTRWSTGYSGSNYFVEYIFVGTHFVNRDAILFNRVWATFEHLELWHGDTGIRYTYNELAPTENSITITYEPPPTIEVGLDPYKVIFTRRRALGIENNRKISIESRPFICIESNSPTSWLSFRTDVLNKLASFLAFAIGTAMIPFEIWGVAEDTDENGEIPSVKVSIFYRARGAGVERKKPRPLFTFEDVESELGNLIKNWVANSDKLKLVYDLYLGFYYTSPVYSNLVFLTYCQILETYFREVIEGMYLGDDEWAPVAADMLHNLKSNFPNISKEHWERLEGLLRYGNEYTLRAKLKSIVKKHLKDYSNAIESRLPSKSKELIARIVDTRNYWTHLGKPGSAVVTDPKELSDLVRQVWLLVTLCLFKSTGFSRELVEKLVSRGLPYV